MLLQQQHPSGLGDGVTAALLQVAMTPQNSQHYTTHHVQPSRTKLTYSPSNGPYLNHHHHLPGTPVSASSIGYVVQQQSPMVMGVATLQHATPMMMHQATPMMMHQTTPMTSMDNLGGKERGCLCMRKDVKEGGKVEGGYDGEGRCGGGRV